VDEQLSERIAALIDALTYSHTQAEVLTQALRAQRLHVGLEYDHPDHDIKQLIGKVRYMQRVAERWEGADAATRRDQEPD
jgi:hypothetical protein